MQRLRPSARLPRTRKLLRLMGRVVRLGLFPGAVTVISAGISRWVGLVLLPSCCPSKSRRRAMGGSVARGRHGAPAKVSSRAIARRRFDAWLRAGVGLRKSSPLSWRWGMLQGQGVRASSLRRSLPGLRSMPADLRGEAFFFFFLEGTEDVARGTPWHYPRLSSNSFLRSREHSGLRLDTAPTNRLPFIYPTHVARGFPEGF